MATINGSEITEITIDGLDVKSVTMDGVKVWEKQTPLLIPAPYAWYKADSITGLSNNDSIATWIDSSTNNLNATSINANVNYKTNAINGKPSVVFNTSGFNTDVSASLLNYTVFYVIKPTNLTGVKFLLDSTANGGISTRFNNATLRTDQKGEYVYLQTTLANSYIDTWFVSMFTMSQSNGDSDQGKLSIDGTQKATSSSSPTPTANLKLRLGNSTAGLEIAEVILYDRATTSEERIAIYNYLQSKYNIPIVFSEPSSGGGGA